jgi:hypothetical protein
MASTFTLQNSINWAQAYVRYKPLLDSNNEPAFTNASQIMQTFLGPPFTWRWNRVTLSAPFTTGAGTQDYTLSVPNLGFVEKAVMIPSGGSGTSKPRELTVKNVMGQTNANEQDQPEFIGTVFDDNAGNITFRLLPPPDDKYNIFPVYQMKPVLFTSITQTWAPIPDEYGYVYNAGFLGLALAFFDDPRAERWLQKFALSLIGISDGLDETQKNLFLGNYLETIRQMVKSQNKTTQATQGYTI